MTCSVLAKQDSRYRTDSYSTDWPSTVHVLAIRYLSRLLTAGLGCAEPRIMPDLQDIDKQA